MCHFIKKIQFAGKMFFRPQKNYAGDHIQTTKFSNKKGQLKLPFYYIILLFLIFR